MAPWKYGGPEEGFKEKFTKWVNSSSGIAIIKKKRNSKIILEAREWHPDARFLDVAMNGKNQLVLGDHVRTVPERAEVFRPTNEEIFALHQRRFVGRFKDAHILNRAHFRSTHEVTAALPVVDTTGTVGGDREVLYYLPAALVPSFNQDVKEEMLDMDDPQYVCMHEDELPSFYFYLPKSLKAAFDAARVRRDRSSAPSPEPEAGKKTLVVDTKKASGAEHEPKVTLEVFNEEEERDLIEFLEFYNVKFNGWHGIRTRMMLREEDIERVKYDSACLRHSTASTNGNGGGKDGANSKDTVKTSLPAVARTALDKLQPIPEDDPSFIRFKKSLELREQIRRSRIRPLPVFTSEYCSHVNAEQDPGKITLTRDLYMDYWGRAKSAEAEVDMRSKSCRACGVAWKKVKETPQEHYSNHREEYNLWLKRNHPTEPQLEPDVRAKSLAPLLKGVPELSWFKTLERIILNKENELLEREQVCRVCDVLLDYAYVDPADHYAEHSEQRDSLRSVHDAAKVTEASMPAVASAVSEAVNEAVEKVMSATRSSSVGSLPTPPSKVFTPLRSRHPLVERADQVKNRQSRRRSLSDSRSLETARSMPASRSASASTPRNSPRTVDPLGLTGATRGPSKTSWYFNPVTNQWTETTLGDTKKIFKVPEVVEMSDGEEESSSYVSSDALWEHEMETEPEIRPERELDLDSQEDTEMEAVDEDEDLDMEDELEDEIAVKTEANEEGPVFDTGLDDEPGDFVGLDSEPEFEVEDMIDSEVESEEASSSDSSIEIITQVQDPSDDEALFRPRQHLPPKGSITRSPSKNAGTRLPPSRPTPLHLRKRKWSDADFEYYEDELEPDEVSPILRAPKKPKKAKDPLFRPGKHEEDHAEIPSPVRKRTPTKKAADVAAAASTKKLARKKAIVPAKKPKQNKVPALPTPEATPTPEKADAAKPKKKKKTRRAGKKQKDVKGFQFSEVVGVLIPSPKTPEPQVQKPKSPVTPSSPVKKPASPVKTRITKVAKAKKSKSPSSPKSPKASSAPAVRPKRKAAGGEKFYSGKSQKIIT